MKRLCFFLLFVVASFQSSMALGVLYAHPARSTNDYQPLWLKSYDATVTITDQMAVTHVDHVFKNETSAQLEGIFVFPLPPNAIVTELALWINGELVVGELMEKDTARAVNLFKLSVFPIDPDGAPMSERRIEITYAEILPYADATVSYSFLMNTTQLSPKPVGRASLTLTSQRNILSFVSSTHAGDASCSLQRVSSTECRAVYGNENTHSEKDFRIEYQLQNDDFALSHLTYAPPSSGGMFFDETGDLSYFLLWITPPDNITMTQVLDKNIVFVADISSSMAGERMA
jgi:hypothetical protein